MPRVLETGQGSDRRKPSKGRRGPQTGALKSNRRGPEDRVYRVRTKVWLAAVKARCPVDSLLGLDRHFLGDDRADLRAFWRIARDDTDPGLSRDALGERSLVDIVGERPGYHHTRAIYHSELWEEILGPRPLNLDRREALLKILLDRLHLFEPNSEDWMAAAELGIDFFGARRRSMRDFKRWLAHFSRKRDIDRLALLSLLFRRAIEASALQEALALESALISSVRRFCCRFGFNSSISAEWEFLIRRRVIAGQQSLAIPQHIIDSATLMLSGWERQCESAIQRRRYEQMLWAGACMLDNQQEPPVTHLVPRCQRVNDYQSNRQDFVHRAGEMANERIRQHFAESMREGVSAEVRFGEMRGYREPMRNWD